MSRRAKAIMFEGVLFFVWSGVCFGLGMSAAIYFQMGGHW